VTPDRAMPFSVNGSRQNEKHFFFERMVEPVTNSSLAVVIQLIWPSFPFYGFYEEGCKFKTVKNGPQTQNSLKWNGLNFKVMSSEVLTLSAVFMIFVLTRGSKAKRRTRPTYLRLPKYLKTVNLLQPIPITLKGRLTHRTAFPPGEWSLNLDSRITSQRNQINNNPETWLISIIQPARSRLLVGRYDRLRLQCSLPFLSIHQLWTFVFRENSVTKMSSS
jgi:hypothetical protein